MRCRRLRVNSQRSAAYCASVGTGTTPCNGVIMLTSMLAYVLASMFLIHFWLKLRTLVSALPLMFSSLQTNRPEIRGYLNESYSQNTHTGVMRQKFEQCRTLRRKIRLQSCTSRSFLPTYFCARL